MNYYSKNLHGPNLEKCYLLAPDRVKQYLSEEINFISSRIKPDDSVLELGCGYGRIVFKLAGNLKSITGIDISTDNIEYANKLNKNPNSMFKKMDALQLEFEDNTFDRVICLQNGICAFNTDKEKLVQEALRVTKPKGKIFFSTYSEKFWTHRLKWFELQAEHGLLGKIDYKKSINNTVVCKDGFSSGAMKQQEFLKISKKLNVKSEISVVDSSCIICTYTKK